MSARLTTRGLDARGLDARGLELAAPPPPHDPRERALVLRIGDWEARVFEGRMFQYFVTRGLWHVQLWHPVARVSILTPSRLTGGCYEVFPVARWKGQANDYASLARLVAKADAHAAVAMLDEAQLQSVERTFVTEIVRSATTLHPRARGVVPETNTARATALS